MINPKTLFELFYADYKIIDRRILNYTSEQIFGMEANNTNHQFDVMLPLTKTAHLNLHVKFNLKKETRADQFGSTITVDEYEATYIANVRRAVKNVSFLYAKGTPTYKVFFPEDLVYYTNPLRDSIGDQIDHFIGKYNLHPELGAEMLDAFTDLKAAFDPARATQRSLIADVGTLITVTSTERNALNLQLQSNLLKIADMYKGQPEMANRFFKQHLLYPYHVDHTHDEFVFTLLADETKNTGLTNIVGKKARFVLKKGSAVRIYTVASLDDMEPGDEFADLVTDDDVIYKMEQIGVDTNPYLIVRNMNADEAELIIKWEE